MHIVSQNISENSTPCVATVGIFDGVHAGHRFLIDQVIETANRKNLSSTVITFTKHPRSVLKADFKPEVLSTLSEKMVQFESTGIDSCVLLDFTKEMAQLSAYQFIKNILIEKLKVRTLIVGHDHRFGHDRTEGFDDYRKYGESLGIEVVQATRYSTGCDKQISSSQIRMAIHKGDIVMANRLLTYPYAISGKVVGGFRVGRKIGFPTANIQPESEDKLIPDSGVYAVGVKWQGLIFRGMLNIGLRPTLNNGTEMSIEVHIIDFDRDIYDEILEIVFIQKIREEQKFDGVSQLILQLNKDKEQVLALNY